jgi:hypothetical protein
MLRCASSLCSKALLIAGLAASWPGQAMDLGATVQVHGFLSQALAHSSANNVGGDSADGLAADLRDLGANLSWRPTPDWLVSAQGLMRWAGATDNGSPRLDYAFLDRSFTLGEDRVGIQIGKIKNPYGFYNTTRDVAQTRPGVILPQSIYFDRIRDFFLAAPGVSFYGEHNGRDVSLTWHAGVIRPEVDDKELKYLFLLGDRPGHFKGKTTFLAQGLLEFDNARWRLGLSVWDNSMRYEPGTDVIGSGTNEQDSTVLSLEHNREDWSFTGEYAQLRIRGKDYALIFNTDHIAQAWYVQTTWRFRPHWQAYGRYDVFYADKDDKSGAAFSAGSGGIVPAYLRYARDKTFGVRFDPDLSWSLFAEFHHVDGDAWLSSQDNPISQLERKWNLLLIQAAYRF